MVRAEQGPDAVILSNRKVEGGVEIVSATDYDEALFNTVKPKLQDNPGLDIAGFIEDSESDNQPNENILNARQTSKKDYAVEAQSDVISEKADGSQQSTLSDLRQELRYLRNIVETRIFDLEWSNYSHVNPVSAEIIKRLITSGISPKLAREITMDAPQSGSLEDAWSLALNRLSDRLVIASDEILDKGGIVALVGPTGVGKTTTIAKLASRYALRRGIRHVALITTDNYRVGAHEQLRTYGRLLDIPMRSASSKEELQGHIDDLADKDLVLIDTAGLSQRDVRISEQLSLLKGSIANVKVYLVLSATTQKAGLDEVINVFRGIDIDGCIVTKLDEAYSTGPVVSALIDKNIPIVYVSDGQKVPEDLHLARADKLINRDIFDVVVNKESSAEEKINYEAGRTVRHAH